jgi:hypothetical protein
VQMGKAKYVADDNHILWRCVMAVPPACSRPIRAGYHGSPARQKQR